MSVGIIGGGLTGLTIGANLKVKSEILEKNQSCGGLCRSYEEEGFTFDQGGHILFSRDKELLKLIVGLLGKNVHKQRRNNKVLINGRLIKYPLENDLAGLRLIDNLKQHP